MAPVRTRPLFKPEGAPMIRIRTSPLPPVSVPSSPRIPTGDRSWIDLNTQYRRRELTNLQIGMGRIWQQAIGDGQLDLEYYRRLGFNPDALNQIGPTPFFPDATTIGAGILSGIEENIASGCLPPEDALWPARALIQGGRIFFSPLWEPIPDGANPYLGLLDLKPFCAMIARGLYPFGEADRIEYDYRGQYVGTALTHDIAHFRTFYRYPHIGSALRLAFIRLEQDGVNLDETIVSRYFRDALLFTAEHLATGKPSMAEALKALNLPVSFEDLERDYEAAYLDCRTWVVKQTGNAWSDRIVFLCNRLSRFWLDHSEASAGSTGDPTTFAGINARNTLIKNPAYFFPRLLTNIEKINDRCLDEDALTYAILSILLISRSTPEQWVRDLLNPDHESTSTIQKHVMKWKSYFHFDDVCFVTKTQLIAFIETPDSRALPQEWKWYLTVFGGRHVESLQERLHSPFLQVRTKALQALHLIAEGMTAESKSPARKRWEAAYEEANLKSE